MPFPPKNLSPNRAQGCSWKTLYTTKSKYREVCFYEAKQQLNGWKPNEETIGLTLTFRMPDRRHRDFDNCLASCKGLLDGVADALGVNDKRFEPILLKRGEVLKGGSVIVEIDQ